MVTKSFFFSFSPLHHHCPSSSLINCYLNHCIRFLTDLSHSISTLHRVNLLKHRSDDTAAQLKSIQRPPGTLEWHPNSWAHSSVSATLLDLTLAHFPCLLCAHFLPVASALAGSSHTVPCSYKSLCVLPYLKWITFQQWQPHENMPLSKSLLHPSPEEEKKHKKKRLVQSPNSYFMDVKCLGCYKITTVFSHAQTVVVLCVGCSTVLCQPAGGKARLTEGCSFRRKQR